MPFFAFEGRSPQVHPEAWVAPTATVIGDVVIEAGASIWYGAVLRADFGILIRAAPTSRTTRCCTAVTTPRRDRARRHGRPHVRRTRCGGRRGGADRERRHRAGRRPDRGTESDRGGQPGPAGRGDPRRRDGPGCAGRVRGRSRTQPRGGSRQPVDLPGTRPAARGRDMDVSPRGAGLGSIAVGLRTASLRPWTIRPPCRSERSRQALGLPRRRR